MKGLLGFITLLGLFLAFDGIQGHVIFSKDEPSLPKSLVKMLLKSHQKSQF